MKIAALVLAGGLGSRMGGQDKGLVSFAGKPLIAHVVERLMPQVDTIVINANRNLEDYATYAPYVFADEQERFQLGPLSGLVAASKAEILADYDWLLVVPCDTPYLPLNLVDLFMQAAVAMPDCSVFYAQTVARQHYSIMFLRTIVLTTVAPYLDDGQRTIRGWLQQQGAQAVQFAEEADFANCNTPEEME